MDQIAAMRAFVRVVEAGTFTRAAVSLKTPKPTVTKLIRTLEAHLQTKLLNRTTRRVSVTPDGAAYYERVLRLLTELDELDASMTVAQATPKGRLRIDLSGSLAVLVVIPALPEFYERYPDIQIDLGVTDRAVNLIEENVDCVIRGGELTDQSLIARRIAEMSFITCAAPAYLQRHGEPQQPSDLEHGHTVVTYVAPGTGRIYMPSFEADGALRDVKARSIISVNDGSAYVAAGLAGLGVIQAPIFMVQDHLEAGALRAILAAWSTETMPLHVVYPPNRHLSNKLRVFVDWVAELFARENFGLPAKSASVR